MMINSSDDQCQALAGVMRLIKGSPLKLIPTFFDTIKNF